MTRTAFMRLIRRAYQISTLSMQTQRPIAEVEELLQMAASRRQVLNGLAVMGLTGMGATLARPTLAQPNRLSNASFEATPSLDRVLIVGAGIAGLTTAYRLRQAGVAVDVVEASHRVAGRLVSLTNLLPDSGTVELGGEFIDSRHTYILSLAAELGLEVADLRLADEGLEREILYFQGQRVSESKVIEEFAALAHRINRDLETLETKDITYTDPSPQAVRLDRLSLADYLNQASISPLIEQLVRVAYVTEFGRDAEEQSCLNMLFLIGAEVGKWSTYGVSDERYHVVGGNDQIPKRLAAKMEDAIELGTVLESIRSTSDHGYQVSLRQNHTSLERIYDRIVLTLPFTVLRQIEFAVEMPPIKRLAINTLGYGTCSKLAVPYRERIWRSRYGCTVSIYTDKDFQNTWESARYSPGPGGWVTDLRGGKQGILLGRGTPEKHANLLTQELERLFPGIEQVSRGKALRSVWVDEPYALGSYSCYLPGQWTTIGGTEAERIGNIWFAGEHCSLGSQGYMNGACETAEAAAKDILLDLGLASQV